MHVARWLLLLPAVLAFSATPSTSRAEELRIDGFESGQLAFLQLGLAIGDILAVRLVPTGPCPCQITSAKFLLGTSSGDPLIGEMDIRIWEDPGGSRSPGAPIFEGRIAPTSDNNILFQFDLEPENIIVNGPFRLGLEIVFPEQTDPEVEPSLFRDGDFTITPQQNFVFDANSQTWSYSEDFFIFGDWILRADVEPPTPSVPTLSNLGIVVLACVLASIIFVWSARRAGSGAQI